MKVFTYSQARQNLAKLLDMAQKEDVEIRRRDGSAYVLKRKETYNESPFNVPGIKTKAITSDVLEAFQDSRR